MILEIHINRVIKTANGLYVRMIKHSKDMFTSFDNIITHISFDNDIDSYDDGDEVTGFDCVKWLCDYIQDNNLDISNLTLNFHTANVVGKENMMCYWNNFKENYEEGL